MSKNWLNGVEKQIIARILVGMCALIWSIWNCGNNMVYNKVETSHFLHVICIATYYWIHEWSYFLQRCSGRLWFLDVGIWRRLHEVSTTRLSGGLLDCFMMLKHTIFFTR
jgi:hypothetical protein